jgi:hypothetical protein
MTSCGVAQAHGPVAPVASDYKATVATTPPGLDAKVIDGDQRMWLQVPPHQTVTVLDYRGNPYLRFTSAGVQVNQNSEMYDLNQTPAAAVPRAALEAGTPPDWHAASSEHAYDWHDGRLHALASVAITAGTAYVGGWRIPLQANGRRSALAGGVYRAEDPPIVWFWPIAVIVLAVLAGWRLHRADLNDRLARALSVTALAALIVAQAGQSLHGRPSVSPLQITALALVLGFAGWAGHRVIREQPGYLTYFAIACLALYEGLTMLPTLLDGFVLIALPAFLARSVTVACLGAGAGILVLVVDLALRPSRVAR